LIALPVPLGKLGGDLPVEREEGGFATLQQVQR